MKEDIYKDLYDNHIKKYEELLEKNVITEYEFNKIKKEFYLKEELSQKDTNDFQNTNKVKEKLTLKEFFLELVKLISNLLKILCAIFVLITAIAIEPYGIYTILWIIITILLLPVVQNIITKKNEKIKKSFITGICIISYFIVAIAYMINLDVPEVNNNEENVDISQNVSNNEVVNQQEEIQILSDEEFVDKILNVYNEINLNKYNEQYQCSYSTTGKTINLYVFTEYKEYNDEVQKVLETFTSEIYDKCKTMRCKQEGLFDDYDFFIRIRVGYQNKHLPNTSFAHFSTLCYSTIDGEYIRKGKSVEEIIKYVSILDN